MTEHERTAIENKLRRHFNTASSEYLCSDNFSALLHQTCQIFEKKSPCAKYFTQLAAFDEQLKKNSIKAPKWVSTDLTCQKEQSSIRRSNPSVSPSINDQTIIISTLPSPNSDTTDDDLAFVTVQEVIDYLLDQCESIVPESTAMTPDEMQEQKRQRRIAKLEVKLSRLSRLIRKLEETEMSLDDMAHGDLYQVEANLKKQAAEVITSLMPDRRLWFHRSDIHKTCWTEKSTELCRKNSLPTDHRAE